LQDEEKESNNVQHEIQQDDNAEKTSNSVDKGKEPEEEEISCIGPSSSRGEMVGYIFIASNMMNIYV
jgi:hypothetical protein